jgi:hypothetical protein
MQQGDQRPLDKVDVFKGVFGSGQTAPPNLSALTHVQNGLSVGAANGGATVPQFSIVTNTSVANRMDRDPGRLHVPAVESDHGPLAGCA